MIPGMLTGTLRHTEAPRSHVRDTSRVLSRRPAKRQTVCVADEIRYRGGQAIRERREDLGLTQGELADEADVSLSSVGRLERGQRIDRAKERKIAKALGWAAHGIDAVYSGEPAPDDQMIEAMDEAQIVGMQLEIGHMSDDEMRRIAKFVAEVQADPAVEFELMARMMRLRASSQDSTKSDDDAISSPRSGDSDVSKTSRR